jgi:hypothetical protein
MTPLSAADFQTIDLHSFLDGEQTCYRFSRTFWSKAAEAKAAGDDTRHVALLLLADVCSYVLRADSPKAPFVPFAFWEGKRTASIEDLDEGQLSFLADIVNGILNPELRARLADLLFVRRKHHNFGKVALDAYIASAGLFASAQWHESTFRLERALAIAVTLRSEKDRIADHLMQTLESHRDDATFFSARIMEALLDYRLGDLQKMAILSSAAAAQATAAQDWHRARDYLLLAAQCHRRQGSVDADMAARRDAAECYVQLADQSPSASVQISHLERAIQSLRSLPGNHVRVDDLHTRILRTGKVAIDEFQAFEQSIDVSRTVQQARAEVTGASFEGAVARMAMLWRPRPKSELREQVLELARMSVFTSSIQKTVFNRRGKVVARRGPIVGADPGEQEEAIRQAMFEQAAANREFVVVSGLLPARAQVAEEHYVSARTLMPLVSRSAFVPFERAELFAEGLAAGFNGDFATALHILMPQFENSIRILLDSAGVITSSIDSDGIQNERDLGALLYLPDTARLFGDDLVFEMQGLLVERCGSNLRNLFAHGLLDVDRCVGGQSIYFWWLTLHLAVMPLLSQDGPMKP